MKKIISLYGDWPLRFCLVIAFLFPFFHPVFAEVPVSEHMARSSFEWYFAFNNHQSQTQVSALYLPHGKQIDNAGCIVFDWNNVSNSRHLCYSNATLSTLLSGVPGGITILSYPSVTAYGRGICDAYYSVLSSGKQEWHPALDYDACISAGASVYKEFYVYSFNGQGGVQYSPSMDPVQDSTWNFIGTAGFDQDVGSPVAFMSKQVALVIGAGLGVWVQLMPYIIGLAVISAIVGFLYSAFRFFRH